MDYEYDNERKNKQSEKEKKEIKNIIKYLIFFILGIGAGVILKKCFGFDILSLVGLK